MFYNKTNGAKLWFSAFSENFIIGFSWNEFSQNCFGHYSVKFHAREKIYLLSCGLKSHWPIRLHDFSEYSFSLTLWVFGMNITDIPRIWELYSCTVNRKGNFIISNSVSYTWSSWYLNWLFYWLMNCQHSTGFSFLVILILIRCCLILVPKLVL